MGGKNFLKLWFSRETETEAALTQSFCLSFVPADANGSEASAGVKQRTYRTRVLWLEGQELCGRWEVRRMVAEMRRRGDQELRVTGQQLGKRIGNGQMLHRARL